MRALLASLLLLPAAAGCGASPSAAPVPVPGPRPSATPSATPSAPASASQAPPAVTSPPARLTAWPEAAGLGRFVPVTTFAAVAPVAADDCWHLFPGFTAVAATPEGAFVVGACGVRLRLVGTRVEKQPTPVVNMSMGMMGSCRAHRMHWAISATSERAAALLASPRCGPDPSAVWANELERFDGTRWSTARVKLGASDPHESDAFDLSLAGDGALWLVVRGDDWHGPPDNAIVRVEGGRAIESRLAIAPELRRLLAQVHADPAAASQLPPVVPYEHYAALAAVSRDEVWVAGGRKAYVSGAATGVGEPARADGAVVWHLAPGGTWHDHVVNDGGLTTVAVGADGTVVAAGTEVHRRSPTGAWETLAPAPESEATSVWVGARDDVWVAFPCRREGCVGATVLHHDGTSFQRVPLDAPPGGPLPDARSAHLASHPGGPVWLVTDVAVWRLERPGKR